MDLYTVSVIIPCYNENKTIASLLEKVTQQNVYEIIVVDDGSTDGTREILTSLKDTFSLNLFFHEKNLGKGGALKTGFSHASGDIILIQDADLEYSPSDYPKLLKPFYDHHADVVYGSRFLQTESHRVHYFTHTFANSLFTFLSNVMTNLNFTDIHTCYKVFKRDLLEKITLKENKFGFCPEFTAKIAKLRCHIFEVSINYHPRRYEEGKKIGFIDALSALICIIRYNLFK